MKREDVDKVMSMLGEMLKERLTFDEEERTKEIQKELIDYSTNERYGDFRTKVISIMKQKKFTNGAMQMFIKLWLFTEYPHSTEINPNLAYINPKSYEGFINYLENECGQEQ